MQITEFRKQLATFRYFVGISERLLTAGLLKVLSPSYNLPERCRGVVATAFINFALDLLQKVAERSVAASTSDDK